MNQPKLVDPHPLRRLPVGAELHANDVHFRVWAPARRRVDVVVDGRATALTPEGDGHFSGSVAAARDGSLYRYRLDERVDVPDPASRHQPQGPHGPSQVVDPSRYDWTDRAWRGVKATGQVIYELHLGTFTPEGTLAAAMRELGRLKELGVTLLEIMPIAEFPGDFGWGYDGVDLFAPSRLYGTPDDLRRFVDTAHGIGLGVVLDVVYNHFGPDGCYLRDLAPGYFTAGETNDWGDAIDFDRERNGPGRELFVANAGYWIDEYHFDGLRLDATQAIRDTSTPHVIAEIAARAREAAGDRSIVIFGENEPQHSHLARPVERGGHGLDALWNDDFHHSAMVAATGVAEAYYGDTRGTPQELVSAVKWGFLFQGQRYAWQGTPRGEPSLDLPPSAFIHFLENHDQVANSAHGARLWQRISPGCHRALLALLLLSPQTPMLFQGEEYGSSRPFLFFADHSGALGDQVRKGRFEFLAQFPSMRSEESRRALADPTSRETFERCKLDPEERVRNSHVTSLYRDLLALRRTDAAFAPHRGARVHGAVLGPEAFVLRFSSETSERLLVVNLGRELAFRSIPEPLIAPPRGEHWEVLLATEHTRYGGDGAGEVDTDEGWSLGAHRATVLRPPLGGAA